MHDRLQMPAAPGPGALTICPLHGRTGLMLAGEADWTTHDKLRAALTMLPVDGTGEIHLDLTGLRFIDVSCTRELIAIIERDPALRLVAYHAPVALRRIIAILYPEVKIEFIETSGPVAREAGKITDWRHPGSAAPATGNGPPLPDIVELILAEHAWISTLIDSLKSALADAGPAGPGSQPHLAWAALAGFLRFHVDADDEVVYQTLASSEPGAVLAIRKASEADAEIRRVVEEAQLSRPGSRAWHMAVQQACSAARSHIIYVESGPLDRCRRTPHVQPDALWGGIGWHS